MGSSCGTIFTYGNKLNIYNTNRFGIDRGLNRSCSQARYWVGSTTKGSATMQGEYRRQQEGEYQQQNEQQKPQYQDTKEQPKYHDKNQQPQHLIVLVNGLFGQAAHWDYMTRKIKSKFDDHVHIHASQVNQMFTTYDGIDTCGERLAEEIIDLVSQPEHQQQLKRISFVGHSMGGLIARYAIACLYDDQAQTVAGLQPCHFITMATPHVGFDAMHDAAEVPFCIWAGDIPVVGGVVGSLLDSTVPVLSSYVLGRSGAQFFLRDGHQQSDGLPLLYHMAFDHCDTCEKMQQDDGVIGDHVDINYSNHHHHRVPRKYSNDAKKWKSCMELMFVSALGSFRTRTLYANRSGDHLVGWANSSLRFREELEDISYLKDMQGVGVVREDPLETCAAAQPTTTRAHQGWMFENAKRYSHPLERQARIHVALENLKSLEWRRIDVCFKDTRLPLLSHQHIMVQRPLINSAGCSTAQHLAEQLYAMDQRFVASSML